VRAVHRVGNATLPTSLTPQDARDKTTAQVQGGAVRAGPLVRLLDGRVHRQVGRGRFHAHVQRGGVLAVAEEAPGAQARAALPAPCPYSSAS
jgi:hypothetical protein